MKIESKKNKYISDTELTPRVRGFFSSLTSRLSSLIFFILISIFSSLISPGFASASQYGLSIPANNLGLVGYWTFDGPDMLTNVRDRSGQGNHGSLVGQASTTTVPGKIGQALNFDGVDDRVNTGSDFVGTNPMSISLWMNARSLGEGSVGRLVTNQNTTGFYFRILVTNSTLAFSSNGGNNNAVAGANAVVLDQWRHVSVTRDASGVANIYVNGVLSGTANQNSGTPNSGSTNVIIGNHNAGVATFDGTIDDVRVYNRVLSASEISQMYQSTQSKFNETLTGGDSLSSGLVGWWTFDGPDMLTNVRDRSGQGNNGSLVGQASTTTVPGKLGQALLFDGVDDYVNGGSASSLDDIQLQGGSGLTYSTWIYPKSNGEGGNGNIIQKSIFSAGGWAFFINTNNLKFQKDFDGATNLTAGTDSGLLQFNQWYHVVMTWDGSALRSGVGFYVNGVKQTTTGTSDGDGNALSDAALSIHIGGNSGANTFNGSIDDVRIYNRALSAGEITQLYNLGR